MEKGMVKYNIKDAMPVSLRSELFKSLLKMCGPEIWLHLFTFGPIASKQLNSLTTIVSLS